MTAHEPSNSVPIPGLQDRLAVFLQKAAPILAAERGLTPISRLKLESVARDLGMSSAEFDEALRNTQHGPAEPTPPPVLNDPQAEVFRRYLRKKLRKLTHGILTPDQERRLLAIAWKRHTIPEPEARQLIQEISAELGQRRISLDDAATHVREFIAKQLADVTWVDHATAERLILAGQTWGLSAEQVDALIREEVEIQREQRSKASRWNRGLGSIAGCLFLAIVAGFGGWALYRDETPPAAPVADDSHDDSASGSLGSHSSTPKWWDYELAVAIAQARREIIGFVVVYDQLRSIDPAERGAAYEGILAMARKSAGRGQHAEILRELVIGLHALEPDDKTAAHVRDRLLALALVARRELPETDTDYQLAFWSVRVALAGLNRDHLPPSRADALKSLVERTLGVSIESTRDFDVRERQCLAALAKLLFRQLTSGVVTQPALALNLHTVLTRFAASCLAEEELERLTVKFVVAALPAVGERWFAYQELVLQCVASRDAAIVLQFVDVYEKLSAGGLQDFLARELLARAKVKLDVSDVESVARAVRQALGGGSPAATWSSADRWKQLRPRAEAALARADRSNENVASLLHETVELSHLVTLACALSQDEFGAASFDELWKKGPPTAEALAASKSDDDPPPDRSRPGRGMGRDGAAEPVVEFRRRDLERWVLQLKSYDRLPAMQRPTILRNLAALAATFDDVAPEHAAAIAHYLLGIKPKLEHDAIKDATAAIAHWKGVRLALADQLAAATLAKDELRQLLETVLRRNVGAEEIGGSREGLRQELLRSVLLELPTNLAPDRREAARTGFDLAEHALREHFPSQAKMLGLDLAALRPTHAVAPQLRLLIEQWSSRLRLAKLSPDDRQTLDQLPHELAAADFLGTNDLRGTVLLHRIWLQLVAIELNQKYPDSAIAARPLLVALDERNSRATQVIDQLRNGLATELRMWLLAAPKGKRD